MNCEPVMESRIKLERKAKLINKQAQLCIKIEDSDTDESLPKPTRKRKVNAQKAFKIEDSDTDESLTKSVSNTTRTRKLKTQKTIKIEDSDTDESLLKPVGNTTKKRKVKSKKTITLEDSDTDGLAKPVSRTARKRKVKTETQVTVEEPVVKKIKSNSSEGDVDAQDKKESIKVEDRPLWKDYELLSELQNLDPYIASNVTNLFDDGNTIPFIARYRKDATGNMSPEQLRDIKESYDKILALKARSQTVLKCIEKTGNLTPDLKRNVLSAKTVEEVEHIYAPYKPGGKRTLSERAKALGLEEPAVTMLYNTSFVDIYKYLDQKNEELNSFDKIEKGIMHIIAHIISTNIEVLTFLRKLRSEVNFTIEVKKSAKKTDKATKTKSNKNSKINNGKPVDESKFENYFDFKTPVRYVKPHQVLAINRGESQKVLSVKVAVPDFVFNKFSYFCAEKWVRLGPFNHFRKKILDDAIQDSYTRLVQPLLIREIRSELKTRAEKASYDVFSNNLKQILLAAPVKGRPILGIDPGFSNGCKIAIVSSTGTLLQSEIIYPHRNKLDKDVMILQKLCKEYNCNLIALGNGTACRETEAWLSDLIKSGAFAPLDVTYTIVSENGASIYSCSPEAKKEFPTIDPNIISAVSLARRVQEPLAELVKVEPKHLGVGMYQHDLPKKQLEEALDEVVSECVSFVGVDLNTASQCLLRRIAGLTDKRATQIIEYRLKNGPFLARDDLTEVKGIGAKIFKQCAGFLRVGPLTAKEAISFYNNAKTNKLDCTIIHPESYTVTLKFIKKLNLRADQIGENSFIDSMKCKARSLNYEDLSKLLNTTEQTLKLIVEALSKPLNHDLRNECPQTPLFKKGLTNLIDLKIGSVLTGRVANVTHFGCFIDVGVGCDGLIHISKMKGQSLEIGNRVEVIVLHLDINRKRIGLELLKTV